MTEEYHAVSPKSVLHLDAIITNSSLSYNSEIIKKTIRRLSAIFSVECKHFLCRRGIPWRPLARRERPTPDERILGSALERKNVTVVRLQGEEKLAVARH